MRSDLDAIILVDPEDRERLPDDPVVNAHVRWEYSDILLRICSQLPFFSKS